MSQWVPSVVAACQLLVVSPGLFSIQVRSLWVPRVFTAFHVMVYSASSRFLRGSAPVCHKL